LGLFTKGSVGKLGSEKIGDRCSTALHSFVSKTPELLKVLKKSPTLYESEKSIRDATTRLFSGAVF
jgi:hypothetical protein